MNTTLTTVLYTSKTLSDGTHPLMFLFSETDENTSLQSETISGIQIIFHWKFVLLENNY